MLQFVLVTSVVALSGVLRYGPSGTFVNLTSGNNLVAANYPPPNQPVTARSDFVVLYDLSQVPSYAPATPYANLGNVECGALTTNTCHRQCTGCSNGEIISCPNKQHWAVTFDDGPAAPTSQLLTDLGSVGVKATFFVLGSQIVQFPDQLKQAFDQGHQICIHTWAHRALTSMTTAVVVTDLEWTLRAVQDVTGVRPNCIRPPYGDLDDRIRAIFRAMKLTVYLWNYDTEDWRLNTNPSAIDVVAIARSFAAGWNSRYPGVISLEHDYTVATASKGKGLVEAVKSQGMVPMSISQCLSGSSGGTPPSAFPPSTNGQCGPGPKTSCPDSTCCSQYGYCGITDAHCLIGCQPLYGRCAGVTVTTTTSSAATTTSSASPSSTVVPAWNDCVKGVSVCQSGYVCCVGKLDVATGKTTCRPTSDCAASPSSTTTASTQPSSSNIPVSTNGQCGSVTKTKCPGTNCCSQYGWCGTSGAHCGTGCQRLYGRCT